MLHISLSSILIMLIFLIIMKAMFEQFHLLSFIILIETLILLIIFLSLTALSPAIHNSAFVSLIIITLSVCETTLGLSLLVANIRSTGKDSLTLMTAK